MAKGYTANGPKGGPRDIAYNRTRERKPLGRAALDIKLSKFRQTCLGAPTQSEVTEAAVQRMQLGRKTSTRSLDAMAEALVERVAQKLADMDASATDTVGEDGRFVSPQEVAGTGFPFAGVRKTGRTIPAEIFRQGIIVLGLRAKSFATLFGISVVRVRRMMAGTEEVPLGFAEYLEMRVARMVRGLAAATGTPVMVEGDILSEVPDAKQRRALEALLTGAGH